MYKKVSVGEFVGVCTVCARSNRMVQRSGRHIQIHTQANSHIRIRIIKRDQRGVFVDLRSQGIQDIRDGCLSAENIL